MIDRRLRKAEAFIAADPLIHAEEFWEKVQGALEAIAVRIDAAVALVPSDLAERFNAAAAHYFEGDFAEINPYKPDGVRNWLHALEYDHGRMPETMPADGARRLFEALLGDAGPIGDMLVTCKVCGLPRPIRPIQCKEEWDFLGACPACGAAEWNWSHLDGGEPWRELKDGRMPNGWWVERNRLMEAAAATDTGRTGNRR